MKENNQKDVKNYHRILKNTINKLHSMLKIRLRVEYPDSM